MTDAMLQIAEAGLCAAQWLRCPKLLHVAPASAACAEAALAPPASYWYLLLLLLVPVGMSCWENLGLLTVVVLQGD